MQSDPSSKYFHLQSAKDTEYQSPLIYFFIFLIFTSAATITLFDVWHAHFKTKRNPHLRNAWVEHAYKALPKQPGEKLIIIISNSQGYGLEVKDNETYAYLIENNLNSKSKSPIRVLNWSLHGGGGPEFVVLLAAAHRLSPDILLFVTAPGNFQDLYMSLDEYSEPKIPWASDCRFLLGFSDIRKHIPKPFIKHFFKFTNEVDIYLGRYYPLWRYRNHFTTWLKRNGILKHFEKSGKKTHGKVKNPIHAQLFGYCLEATASLNAKKVFVLMPNREFIRKRYPNFLQQYHHQLNRAGYEVWDLSDQVSDSLSDNHFRTMTHLNKKGHAKLADLLTERLTS